MTTQNILKNEKWNEWFAGLTDGDGCFCINNKEKSVSFELTTHITDIRVVNEIKNKLKAGSVRKRSNSESIRYRVKAKNTVIDILNRVNGKLFNPARIPQFLAACELLEVTPILPKELTVSYSYLAGLIDSDGTLTISTSHSSAEDSQISGVQGRIIRLTNAKAHNQIILKITSKYPDYVTLIHKSFGFGSIYTQKANIKKRRPNPLYHWTIRSFEDFQLLYETFRKFPLKSLKMHRMRLVLIYFKYKELKYHLKEPGTLEARTWAKFAKLWFKYSY